MNERDKILTACGWRPDEELPLVAERIVNHAADRIESLKTTIERIKAVHEELAQTEGTTTELERSSAFKIWRRYEQALEQQE